MRAREKPDFARDLTDLIEGAPVRTPVADENVIAEVAFAQALEGAGGELALVLFFLGNRFDDFFPELADELVALFLRMFCGVERVVEARAVLLLDLLCQRFVKLERRNDDLDGIQL